MVRAEWHGKIIAESERTILIEGNHYFPYEDVNKAYLVKSDHQSVCPWKGVASYYDVIVAGEINKNAAWYYPEPKEAAQEIKDYVAFWHGVVVR